MSAIEIKDLKNNVTFKVNGKKLKSYIEYQPHEDDTRGNLKDPPHLD